MQRKTIYKMEKTFFPPHFLTVENTNCARFIVFPGAPKYQDS